MNEISPESDYDLIQGVRHNDALAFDRLFKKYSPKVYGFALRYLKSVEESEGVVQDLFVYVWEHRKELRTDTKIQAFFFTIAYNLIRKIFRKESYKQAYVDAFMNNEQVYDDSARENIDYNSTIEEVERVISGLPPRCRRIFEMSRMQGKNGAEIAEELQISRATVDNQISIALKYIRSKVSKADWLIALLFLSCFWSPKKSPVHIALY